MDVRDHQPLIIPESRMEPLLPWDSVTEAVEQAMIAVSNKDDKSKPTTDQPPRAITRDHEASGLLFAMPAFVKNMEYRKKKHNTLACKLVTSFSNNNKRTHPLPNIMGNVFLFDYDTGLLECIMGGNLLTGRRTAAASTVATRYICKNKNTKFNILTILGPGVQGQAHTVALHKEFNFNEIRVWSRSQVAVEVCGNLKKQIPDANVIFYKDIEPAVKDADVIVTATYSSTPLIKLEWIKPHVHINAIGAGENHHSELSIPIYKKSKIYVDNMEGAKQELRGLKELGCDIQGEIGELILNKIPLPTEGITVFHNMGMASLDAVAARVAYENYKLQCDKNKK